MTPPGPGTPASSPGRRISCASSFPCCRQKTSLKLPEQLRNPLKYKFRSILYAAEGTDNRLKGFALSMHAPDLHFAYPYFSGYAEEKGEGEGLGNNLNIPLPESLRQRDLTWEALAKALRRVARFAPRTLIVALGLDPVKGDPTGSWSLTAKDFERNGRMIGELRLPTLVIQEGGYRIRSLGSNAKHFFQGLTAGAFSQPSLFPFKTARSPLFTVRGRGSPSHATEPEN